MDEMQITHIHSVNESFSIIIEFAESRIYQFLVDGGQEFKARLYNLDSFRKIRETLCVGCLLHSLCIVFWKS